MLMSIFRYSYVRYTVVFNRSGVFVRKHVATGPEIPTEFNAETIYVPEVKIEHIFVPALAPPPQGV